MAIIYIRHTDDNNPDKTYSCDQKITKRGVRLAELKCNRLISLHGIPTLIITSPFRRARQTANIFKSLTGCKIKVDVRLSRYSPPHNSQSKHISSSTVKYGPPIYETPDSMKRRINDVISEQKNKYKRKNIWVITHNVVFLELYKKYNRHPDKISFCHSFTIQ